MRGPLGTVIVENQGGGGGTIGATTVAHAKAGRLYAVVRRHQFADHRAVSDAASALRCGEGFRGDFDDRDLVDRDRGASQACRRRTLGEFIEYAKANQKKLSYASAGTGTVTHLAGELFKQLTQTPDILHVPYRGAGPGLIDLIAGVVPMMTPNITSQVLSFHRGGDVRILAVCAPARLKAAPEIPAAVETLPGTGRGLDLRRSGAGGNAAGDHRSDRRRDR